jgi:hypothetical protein
MQFICDGILFSICSLFLVIYSNPVSTTQHLQLSWVKKFPLKRIFGWRIICTRYQVEMCFCIVSWFITAHKNRSVDFNVQQSAGLASVIASMLVLCVWMLTHGDVVLLDLLILRERSTALVSSSLPFKFQATWRIVCTFVADCPLVCVINSCLLENCKTSRRETVR